MRDPYRTATATATATAAAAPRRLRASQVTNALGRPYMCPTSLAIDDAASTAQLMVEPPMVAGEAVVPHRFNTNVSLTYGSGRR